MDTESRKRKAEPDQRDVGRNKKAKSKKKWSMPLKEGAEARSIQPGDVGIWATCAMNKEAPSVADLRDLFQEYASQMYGETQTDGAAESLGGDGDIESEIQKEIEGIRKPDIDPLFRSVRIGVNCLLFFRTRPPVEPVSFVHRICLDTANAIDKATERGLDDVARKVLEPHFHGTDQVGKKFAIRVSIRNHKQLTRDEVIKRVATAVGKGHKVDLSGYDLLILVEIYQNILGMSVVGSDFEELKRFNIAELRDASMKTGVVAEVEDQTI